MKEYHALEIYEMSKHAPPRTWYRSDLYPTREMAKKAFLDLKTYEALTALYCIQGAENPPFHFDGEYEDIDDYAKAYEDGVPEIVEIIDNLLAWVKEEKEEWVEKHWIEFGIQNFNVHEETKIRKSIDHQAKLERIYQFLQELVDITGECRKIKDCGLMADAMLEFRKWAERWLKQNKEHKK
jgi:hypothetical protein